MKLPFFHEKKFADLRLNTYLWRETGKGRNKMEDFLEVILIIGIVVIGIAKSLVEKSLKTKPTQTGSNPSPVTQKKEVAPKSTPLPEAWGKVFPSQEDFFPTQPNPIKSHASNTPKTNKKTTIKETKSFIQQKIDSTQQNNLAHQEPIQGSSHSPTTSEEDDFMIHSVEEARRAIVWGEILQRKY